MTEKSEKQPYTVYDKAGNISLLVNLKFIQLEFTNFYSLKI